MKDVTVTLDASRADLSDAAAVAAQVPRADSLAAGTRVAVLRDATRGGGVLRRLLRARTLPVSRALRCAALLARGYVDIGAGTIDGAEAAWGFASPHPGPPAASGEGGK